jgi:hypothetical protein
MKFIRLTSTAFLFATMIPVYAQHDQQSEKQGESDSQGKGRLLLI